MKHVWAIIPARGGSKGVPRKNVRPLGGKPLVAYSIETAQACPEITRVLVSTDDAEIAAVSRSHGAEVPFLRPAELSGDRADLTQAMYYTLDRLAASDGAPDAFVVMIPTHPFRDPAVVGNAVRRLGSNVKVTAAIPLEVNLSRCWFEHQGRAHRLGTRDEPIRLFSPNGALLAQRYFPKGCRYAENPEAYLRHLRERVPPQVRPMGALIALSDPRAEIDIDTPSDWARAESCLRGEPLVVQRRISSLPFTQVGCDLLWGPHPIRGSAFDVPFTLEPGRRRVLHLGPLPGSVPPAGESSFHELILEDGGIRVSGLFNTTRDIRAILSDRGIRIETSWDGAGDMQAWVGALAEDSCDIAVHYSLPPLWTYDPVTCAKFNLQTGQRILGRQDLPVIHEEGVPVTAEVA